jgi:hypothetical protein
MGSCHQGGTFKPNKSVSNKNIKVKKNIATERELQGQVSTFDIGLVSSIKKLAYPNAEWRFRNAELTKN